VSDGAVPSPRLDSPQVTYQEELGPSRATNALPWRATQRRRPDRDRYGTIGSRVRSSAIQREVADDRRASPRPAVHVLSVAVDQQLSLSNPRTLRHLLGARKAVEIALADLGRDSPPSPSVGGADDIEIGSRFPPSSIPEGGPLVVHGRRP
jgi:hypothetical protein